MFTSTASDDQPKPPLSEDGHPGNPPLCVEHRLCPCPESRCSKNRVRSALLDRLKTIPLNFQFQYLFNGTARKDCVDVHESTLQLRTLCCTNGDPLGKKLLRYTEKDGSQTLCHQCAEKVSLPSDCWWWCGRWPRKLRHASRLSPSRTTPPSAQGLHAPLSDDGVRRDDFIFECGTATNVRFDGPRGSLHTGVQVQLSTGRRSPKTATSRGRPPQRRNDHDPRTPRKGRLRPGLFILHMVQRSWPRSRSQMLRIRGKQPQLQNDMTSHWCSRYSLSLHSC